MNRWAVRNYETLLKVSITYVVWHLTFKLLDRILPTPAAVIVALNPAAGIFAGLHGLRGAEFYAAAFIVAVVMPAPLYLEDHLPGNQTFTPFSVAGVFGVHRAINIQQGEGDFSFVSDMLQTQPSMLWANGLALFLFLVTFVAVRFAGKLVVPFRGVVVSSCRERRVRGSARNEPEKARFAAFSSMCRPRGWQWRQKPNR